MKQVKYCKFCCHRERRFQIQTTIYEEENMTKVVKKALYPEGIEHIQSMENKRKILENIYKESPEVQICNCASGSEREMVFDYIDGERLDKIVRNSLIYGEDRLFEVLDKFYDLIMMMACSDVWERTQEFTEVFGNVEFKCKKNKSSNQANIDMIFSNIIVQGEKYFITDYEWVFSFPIPTHYIFYRALFLNSDFSQLREELQDKIWERYAIDKETRMKFLEMEENLQKYILGRSISVVSILSQNVNSCVNINKIPWENYLFNVCVYGFVKKEKKFMMSRSLSSDAMKLEVKMKDEQEIEKVQMNVIPSFSIITIKCIIAKREGEVFQLEYTVNAELKIGNNLYFTEAVPYIEIVNNKYDEIIVEYNVIKQDDSMVQQIVNYIIERQKYKDEAEKYYNYNLEVEEKVEKLAFRAKALEEKNKQFELNLEEKNKQILEIAERAKGLEQQQLKLKNEKKELDEQLVSMGDMCNELKKQLEEIKNLKWMKIYYKLKGGQ